MKPLVYKKSTRKTLGNFFLFSLMFGLLAVTYFIGLSGEFPLLVRLFCIVISIIGTLFFGMCAVIFFKMLIKNSVIFKVDENGIYDATSYISLGQIAWEDIKTITYKSMGEQKFIAIDLVDDEKYIPYAGSFKRLCIRANKRLGYPAVVLSFTMLRVDPEWLLEELQKRKEYYS